MALIKRWLGLSCQSQTALMTLTLLMSFNYKQTTHEGRNERPSLYRDFFLSWYSYIFSVSTTQNVGTVWSLICLNSTSTALCIHVCVWTFPAPFWMILKFFKEHKKAKLIFQSQSHNRMCAYDSWLTPTAIWYHYAGRRSGAFYDRSQYIPQVWEEREQETKNRHRHDIRS